MDILTILEQFGIPVAVALAFGFFIWKQNRFIQSTLMNELDQDFKRLEGIIIKLIDQQKLLQTNEFPELHKELARLEGSYHSIVRIISSLNKKIS